MRLESKILQATVPLGGDVVLDIWEVGTGTLAGREGLLEGETTQHSDGVL